MREKFEKNSPVTEGKIQRNLKTMLIKSKRDINRDTVEVVDYDEEPNDLSAKKDPSELLVRGKLSYWMETLDDREDKRKHTFEVRDCDDDIEISITDHANVL